MLTSVMKTVVAGVAPRLSERLSFHVTSAAFIAAVGVLLYVSLAAAYPPVHDTMHGFRHALAIVPCH